LTAVAVLLLSPSAAFAQADRHDVRAGNRKFRKDNWKEADIAYRKALVKDSTSFAANYNLGNTLYRQESYDEAAKTMERVKDIAPSMDKAADYHYNVGDIAIAGKNWQAAVDAFRQSLLLNPGDLEAKENYIYAKKMLENQQQNGGGGGQNDQDRQDDNQQQNQDGQDNQDQQNQSGDNQQDQNQEGQNRQGQDNPQDQQNQGGRQPVKISPQQAQQMLNAIQAKEKQTQDKVNREKAEALKSRQKEKNW